MLLLFNWLEFEGWHGQLNLLLQRVDFDSLLVALGQLQHLDSRRRYHLELELII